MAFSPGGELLAAGSYMGGIGLFDPRTSEQLYLLQGHKGGVTQVGPKGVNHDFLADTNLDLIASPAPLPLHSAGPVFSRWEFPVLRRKAGHCPSMLGCQIWPGH